MYSPTPPSSQPTDRQPGPLPGQRARGALPVPTVSERAGELERATDELQRTMEGSLADPRLISAMEELAERVSEVRRLARRPEVDEELHVALSGTDAALAAFVSLLRSPGNGPQRPVQTALRSLWIQALAEYQRPQQPAHGSPSFGFEWQIGDAKVVTADVPSKTMLKQWIEHGREFLRLEVDGHDIEFITSPVTDLEALGRQLRCIEAEVGRLEGSPGKQTVYRLPEPAKDDETGEVLLDAGFEVRVVSTSSFVHGKVQATTGRTLDQLAGLLRAHGFTAGKAAIADIDPFRPKGRAAALLYLVRYYVLCLEQGKREAQGPKVLLPVMSRTDFRSAYLTLTVEEQEDFRRCVDHHGTRHLFDDYRALKLMPITGRQGRGGGYLGPAGYVYEGPTIGAWFDSIVDGHPTTPATEPVDRDNDGSGPRGDDRDLLSPPIGYPAHRQGRHFTYAMGRYGVAADGSMLFEVRAVEEDKAYGVGQALALMLKFATSQLPGTGL